MNKFLKFLLLIPSVLAVLIFIIGYLLPSHWQVERSIVINHPPLVIYPLVANFKQGWSQWSDFDYQDPGIQYSYSGPDLGTGASRSWMSTQMGNGSQTITAANPATGIQFELKMENTKFDLTGAISLVPVGRGSQVTWRDSGDTGNNIVFRYMASMMNMMMGPTFERSLTKLKEKAEAAKEH